MAIMYKQLGSHEVIAFDKLMKLFGEMFEDMNTYQGAKPSEEYIKDFLKDNTHIVLVAQDNESVVGGLVAYELKKFEQERSEIYIYDLAVSNKHQRKGIATTLVENLKRIAQERGISSLFVQADKADAHAISFYQSLGARQTDTYNFDIEL